MKCKDIDSHVQHSGKILSWNCTESEKNPISSYLHLRLIYFKTKMKLCHMSYGIRFKHYSEYEFVSLISYNTLADYLARIKASCLKAACKLYC